jgi:hypothetical protein
VQTQPVVDPIIGTAITIPHTPYGTTNYVATDKRDLGQVTRMIPYYLNKQKSGTSINPLYEKWYGYDFNNNGTLGT